MFLEYIVKNLFQNISRIGILKFWNTFDCLIRTYFCITNFQNKYFRTMFCSIGWNKPLIIGYKVIMWVKKKSTFFLSNIY